MVRDPCNLYTKEPFPQSHAGEQYTVSSRRSLSLSLFAGVHRTMLQGIMLLQLCSCLIARCNGLLSQAYAECVGACDQIQGHPTKCDGFIC